MWSLTLLATSLFATDRSGEQPATRTCARSAGGHRRVAGITRSAAWLLAVLMLAGVLGACTVTGDGPFGRGDPRSYESNGERIYFSGTSDSGDRIRSEGGPGSGMMRHRFACADCHGDDGQGGRIRMMMQSFESPAITWSALTEGHEGHGDDGHPPYTEETLKQAITDGIDPAGNRLDSLMPRWQMSEQDLDDLIGFLKSLDVDNEH
jgi:cytochrome c oxidase subunit II